MEYMSRKTLTADESTARLEQLTARLCADKKNDTEENPVILEEDCGVIR